MRACLYRIGVQRYQEQWEDFARREPYFAVLTDERFLSDRIDDDARRRFFESGEADVAQLLAIAGQVNRGSALDFGCGVGRLALALTRHFESVVGCDVSPAMLDIARRNVPDAHFVSTPSGQFDFVISLIVFQHIPVRDGLDTLTKLLGMLAPGGVAILHFTLRRPGGPLRRFARRIRAAIPLVHRIASRLSGDKRGLPYMQMNEYDEVEIQRRVVDATGAPAVVIPRTEGDIEGALFVINAPRRVETPR